MSLRMHLGVSRLGLAMRKALLPLFLLALRWAGPALAADDTYEIGKTRAQVVVGSKATTSVTITAKKGWHLNAEAPLTLKLVPGATVTVDKSKLARGDLALSNESTARFDVALVALAPGSQSIDAEAGFVLCQESACRPIKEKLVLDIDAKAAKAGAPGPEKPNEPRKSSANRKSPKGG